MKTAERQPRTPNHRSAPPSLAEPASRLASTSDGQFAARLDGSLKVTQSRNLSDQINTSQRVLAQSNRVSAINASPCQMRSQHTVAAINQSPTITAQRKQLAGFIGQSANLQYAESASLPTELAGDHFATAANSENSSAGDSGTGLPKQLKNGVEQLSGIAMDSVRVHYNSTEPNKLGAHAYAQGNDIHVAPRQEKHLPHEAWHVVQQAQGRVRPTMQMKEGVPVNDDSGLEHEADVMGAKALASGAANQLTKSDITTRSNGAAGSTGRGTVQAQKIGADELKSLQGFFSRTFTKTTFNTIIDLVVAYEALPIEKLTPVDDPNFRKGMVILAEVEKEIHNWRNRDSRKGAEEKDKPKEVALERLLQKIYGLKKEVSDNAKVNQDAADKTARLAAEELRREQEAKAKKEAEEKLRIEQEEKARKEAAEKKLQEDRQRAPEEAMKEVQSAKEQKEKEKKPGADEAGYQSKLDVLEANYSTQRAQHNDNKREAIKESHKTRLDLETRFKSAKNKDGKSKEEWIAAKLAKDSDYVKELQEFDATAKKVLAKSSAESHADYSSAWTGSKSKKADEEKAASTNSFFNAEKSKKTYADRKVAKELEANDYPDFSLIYALEMSTAFLSTLPATIQKINNHGNSPEEIKESFKLYYSVVLDGLKDDVLTERVGINTYFVQGATRKASGVEETYKKKANAEDFANVAKLMEQSLKIHSLLGSIKNENIESKPQEKIIDGALTETLSQQFLPKSFRRSMGRNVDKVAFRTWAHMLKEKYVSESSTASEKAGSAFGAVGTVGGLAAANAATLSGGEQQNSSRSITDKAQSDRNSSFEVSMSEGIKIKEGKQKDLVYSFSKDARGSDILDGVSQAATSVKDIIGLFRTEEESKATVRQANFADRGIQINNLIQKLKTLWDGANQLGAITVIPLLGSVLSIIDSIFRGVKYLLRYHTESEIDTKEEQKAEAQQSGLLGATKRITARSKTLAWYSAVDLISSSLRLFAEIFSAVPIANAILGTLSLIISVGKTVYDLIESSYAAAVQQEAKLALERNESGAADRVLESSDDFAVTSIIVEAKTALENGETDHVSVRKLEAFGIDDTSIKSHSVKDIRLIMFREIQRDEKAKTLWQKISSPLSDIRGI